MSTAARTVRILQTRRVSQTGAPHEHDDPWRDAKTSERLTIEAPRPWGDIAQVGREYQQSRIVEIELPPDNPPPQRLACSRCGAEVTKDYESGACNVTDESPEDGGGLRDEHDVADAWHLVHGGPQKPQGICSLSWLENPEDAGLSENGWYYSDDDSPEDGCVGPFKSLRAAVLHAGTGGYVIGSIGEEPIGNQGEVTPSYSTPQPVAAPPQRGRALAPYQALVKEVDRWSRVAPGLTGFLREAWRANDGAEGDSVRRACEIIDLLPQIVQALDFAAQHPIDPEEDTPEVAVFWRRANKRWTDWANKTLGYVVDDEGIIPGDEGQRQRLDAILNPTFSHVTHLAHTSGFVEHLSKIVLNVPEQVRHLQPAELSIRELGELIDTIRLLLKRPTRPQWIEGLPTVAAWWMRERDGREKWFEVSMTSETGEPPLRPTFYDSDRQHMVLVADITGPSDRWFGPVVDPGKP